MNFKVDASWTLFLDRDGVINQRIMGGYVTSPESFQFEKGAAEAIALFRTVFSRIVVVTNQQCIAKKIITERNLFEIHTYMQEKLMEVGGFLDGIYFAPESASDPNNTRKPKPNLAFQAKNDFSEIDFEKSIMVGDTDSDLLFGTNLGMKTVLIRTEEKTRLKGSWEFDSLLEFALAISHKNENNELE